MELQPLTSNPKTRMKHISHIPRPICHSAFLPVLCAEDELYEGGAVDVVRFSEDGKGGEDPE